MNLHTRHHWGISWWWIRIHTVAEYLFCEFQCNKFIGRVKKIQLHVDSWIVNHVRPVSYRQQHRADHLAGEIIE